MPDRLREGAAMSMLSIKSVEDELESARHHIDALVRSEQGLQKRLDDSHEEQRRALWRDVVARLAPSVTCTESKTAINWADKILAAYDERFKSHA